MQVLYDGMQVLYDGRITFERKLTQDEYIGFKIDLKKDIPPEFITKEYMDLCEQYDVLDDVADWLKAHGNNVREGCCIMCYGDHDGCYRYENGAWCWHSAAAICDFGDDELIEELEYRGYYIETLYK